MIPLIRRFVQDGHSVLLAGSGRSAELLRNTFPELGFVSLPGYSVQLASGKYSYMQLVLQVPALVFSVFREHRLIRKIVRNEAVDIVISDNRYGLHCRNSYTVFVTHQVSPVLPAIFRWLEFPLYLILRKLIKRFNQCWIPDFQDPEINLSGKLSHRYEIPAHTRYIGILSRFSQTGTSVEFNPVLRYQIAVIVSGPEPQASLFEKQIFSQLKKLGKSAILIRGMRNKQIETKNLQGFGNRGGLFQPQIIHQVSHLEINDFIHVLKQADVVISRSGYTGIMDFVALGIPAILVPTPGQTEQEYLAARLSDKCWFACVAQHELNLDRIQEPGYGRAETRILPLLPEPDFQFVEDLYREYYKDRD